MQQRLAGDFKARLEFRLNDKGDALKVQSLHLFEPFRPGNDVYRGIEFLGMRHDGLGNQGHRRRDEKQPGLAHLSRREDDFLFGVSEQDGESQ